MKNWYETFELMGDLCSPLKPEEKIYEELVQIVQEHLQPAPSVISERHKFRLRRQEKGESVTQYMVVLRPYIVRTRCSTCAIMFVHFPVPALQGQLGKNQQNGEVRLAGK
ncbi:hypothetical protein QE152_g7710 [Popillia japonica]|uniref:Retrotransposon gag domain-containing protein n=1 Tax=Popillia japonica TaxID=7064 RepID=A0AAW1M932_POPJA